MSQREHILALPDSYIGSRDSHSEDRWIYNFATAKMEWRQNVQYNPGFYKIFDELIVNALDHVTRTQNQTVTEKVSIITIIITPTQIIIRNNGEGIPVKNHDEYNIMIPELIFAHLLTSSNYDATEEKTVGGKNGYGAKLTNIYSHSFTVKTCDGKNLYDQRFHTNMSVIDPPTVTPSPPTKKQFTEISVTPDLTRFFETNTIPQDMLDVLRTRVIDAAAIVAANGCKVYLGSEMNGPLTQIPINTFEKYVRLFMSDDDAKSICYEKCGPRWEVAAILTRSLHVDFAAACMSDRHISFVNGIFTKRGGKHVDTVSRTILREFCEGPGKKLKMKIEPSQLKDALTFFVNSTIVNPSFDSQTKETLTTPVTKFGSAFKISDAFIARLSKEGGLFEEANAVLSEHESRKAKKTDGKRVSRIVGIPKLEDAFFAGKGKESASCTLILTEGDSAATMAIAGLTVVGRERYGVFPLKGKSLNVRDATAVQKNDNKELVAIKKIVGLKDKMVYTDLSELRYGRIMIMTDQDVDGSHIKGLIINMIHSEWPELLRLGFICSLMTPLIKATRRGFDTLSFYSASEYDRWLSASSSGKGWTIKYYKGLGTSVSSEAREYFKSMNLVRFKWDDLSNDSIDLAFNKKRSNDRKAWLQSYDCNRVLNIPAGGADVNFTDFVNDELIHFSNASNIRAIPHVMDGFKPSQRKILWAAIKRRLTTEIKVAQLGGYVSEHAAYHHGEKSLEETIVGMAQNFVGSNNLNLLLPVGQFGTRYRGGEDSSASRYIFTALTPIYSTLFRKADDESLTMMTDDGQTIEPEYYMPVIPMLLVNGSSGIGTGYATTVLPYSPRDLVAALRARLRGDVSDLTDHTLVPWWDGFRGSVSVSGTTVKTRGLYTFMDDDTNRVHITELPVGTWTQSYKTQIDELISDPKPGTSRTVLEYDTTKSTDTIVDIWLTLDPEYFHEARTFPVEFEKKFGLVNSFSTNNMVAFNCDNVIQRFASVGEIMETFFMKRIGCYVSRKKNELARLDATIVEIDAQTRFVQAVVDGTLVVANAEDDVLFAAMKALGLPLLSSSNEDLRGYEYLLRMRVDRLKAKAVIDLKADLAKIQAERDSLNSKTAEQIWLEELDAFELAYNDFITVKSEDIALGCLDSKEKTKGKGNVKKKVKAKATAIVTEDETVTVTTPTEIDTKSKSKSKAAATVKVKKIKDVTEKKAKVAKATKATKATKTA